MRVWQQPPNPPCACSRQPIVIKDRRRWGMPRNISAKKSVSDQRKEQPVLRTAGIAKDKKSEIHLAQQRTSQFYNQPTAASCQSSASNRFPQLTSSGTLACCFIGTGPCVILELCVFESCWLLVSKLVLASLPLQRTGMCRPQVTHPWSRDQLQMRGLQRAQPVPATAQ